MKKGLMKGLQFLYYCSYIQQFFLAILAYMLNYL